MRQLRIIILAVMLFCCFFIVSGCGRTESETTAWNRSQAAEDKKAREIDAAQHFVRNNAVSFDIPLEDAQLPVHPQDKFLYENTCFNFLRGSGFWSNSSLRTDYLSTISARYGNAPLRMMGGFLYAVYETDAGSRVYLFFPKSEGYSHMTGRAVVMCAALEYKDFAGIKEGQTMDDLVAVDRSARLYARGFDRSESSALLGPNAEGWNIVTLHLLRDGVLRYQYELVESGAARQYLIRKIEFAPDFILEELDGKVSYKILPQDYVNS